VRLGPPHGPTQGPWHPPNRFSPTHPLLALSGSGSALCLALGRGSTGRVAHLGPSRSLLSASGSRGSPRLASLKFPAWGFFCGPVHLSTLQVPMSTHPSPTHRRVGVGLHSRFRDPRRSRFSERAHVEALGRLGCPSSCLKPSLLHSSVQITAGFALELPSGHQRPCAGRGE
jgi:hypothetical protein